MDVEGRRRRLIARLVGLRKSNGLTQVAVAELMSVGQSVIAEIESGRSDVRVSTLERYAADNDLWIAATALAYGLPIATADEQLGTVATAFGIELLAA